MRKIYCLVAAFIITIVLVTLGLDMLSAPNSIENILGIVILIVTTVSMIETRCLTNLIRKKK